MFRIRPYKAADKEAIYKICLETGCDGEDGQNIYLSSPDILPDKLVGPFLTYCPDNCFVCTDQQGEVCGYVLTAPDATAFFDNVANRWIPSMMQKYPLPGKNDDLTPTEERISAFHAPFKPFTSPAEWYQSYVYISAPSSSKDYLVGDPSAIKRAFTCAVSTLKMLGSKGVYTCVGGKHRNTVQLYRTLGFLDLPTNGNLSADDMIMLGRII